MSRPPNLALAAAVPRQWRMEAARAAQDPADVFRLATRLYLAGDKIDMNALAAKLGIGRATLYRWIGDRDQLLTEVVWSVTHALVESIAERTPGRGLARLEAMFGKQLELISRAPALRAFLEHEGSDGIRLLTKPGGTHDRLVKANIALVQAEIDAGHYRAPAPLETLIESTVSIGEHFLYATVLGGFHPQVEKAFAATKLLLRESEAGAAQPGKSAARANRRKKPL